MPDELAKLRRRRRQAGAQRCEQRQLLGRSADGPARRRRRDGSSPDRYDAVQPGRIAGDDRLLGLGSAPAATCRCRGAPPPAAARRPAGMRRARRRCSPRLFSTGRRRMRRHLGLAAARRAVQHMDLRGIAIFGARPPGGKRAPRLTASSRVATKKLPAAGGGQRRRHFGRAQAVGVGLDDGGARGRRQRARRAAAASWRRWRRDRRSGRAGARSAALTQPAQSRPRRRRRSRSPKRVNSPSKNSLTLPIGPCRCLAIITSARLCAFSQRSIHS